MKEKLKLKGSLKRLAQLPVYLGVFLAVMDVLIYLIDVKAGIVGTLGLIIYILAALAAGMYLKPLIANELVAFANQYDVLEKRIIEDLILPYAIVDLSGRMIWSNRAFSELTGAGKLYKKNIRTIFPDFQTEKLPGNNGKQKVQEITTQFGSRVFRVSMQPVSIEEALQQTNLLEADEKSRKLVALSFFDETEMKVYIRKCEDNKTVMGLVYLDNY